MQSRKLLFLSCLTVVTLALGAVVTANAGRTYDNRDLRGEYKYAMNEAEWIMVGSPPMPTMLHCVSAGTAMADGAGTITVLGTARCVYPGGTPMVESTSDTIAYEVMPDGQVHFLDGSDPTDITHGQLVNHSRTILLDGTMRTNPNVIYQHGTASKP